MPSVQLPTIHRTSIEIAETGHEYAICEFNDMRKAHFFWEITFDDHSTHTTQGVGQNTVQLPAIWKKVRLNVTLDSKTHPFDLLSKDEFINDVAKTFATNGDQDDSHSGILKQVLATSFSRFKTFSNPEHLAYEAVRGGHWNNPLHLVRNPGALVNVADSNFFIRDFLSLQTTGGEAASSPLEIGNLTIKDEILRSEFSFLFDGFVEDINQHPATQRSPHQLSVFKFSDVAHRDGIQLIPYDGGNTQFGGQLMQHVKIHDNKITSDGALQGIFGSDGAFRDLSIVDNIVATKGKHTIAISGMLSGHIDGNKGTNGQLLEREKITLHPLRIGGEANIHVLSFNGVGGFQYGDITGQPVDDKRKTVSKDATSCWKDVNLPELQEKFMPVFERTRGMKQDDANRDWNDLMESVGRKVRVA